MLIRFNIVHTFYISTIMWRTLRIFDCALIVHTYSAWISLIGIFEYQSHRLHEGSLYLSLYSMYVQHVCVCVKVTRKTNKCVALARIARIKSAGFYFRAIDCCNSSAISILRLAILPLFLEFKKLHGVECAKIARTSILVNIISLTYCCVHYMASG